MKNIKIHLIITACLMIVLGVVCICNPGAGLLSVAWLIGLLTLCSGIFTLAFSLKLQTIMPNAATSTLSGILQILVGIFFLMSNFFVAASLPIVFAMWIMIEGIAMAIDSFEFKKRGINTWWCVLLLGIGAIVLSFLAFKYPIESGKTLSVLIGIGLILVAAVRLLIATFIGRLQADIKQIKETIKEE